MKIISQSVKHTSLRPCVNPVVGLPGVHFHTELLSHTNKNSGLPEYLRQLALEAINGIPSDAMLIYTDGSKDESNRTGSSVFIEKLSIRLSRRNPENCSVLRSELLAIDEELKSILNRTNSRNIWILTDSRSAIQHLQDWTRVDDLVSIRIINTLKTIAKYRHVHFQWIPSHVNVSGNEVVGFLAKRGCSEIATTDYAFTYREIYSLMKIKDKQVWIASPDHLGISRKSPGGALEFKGNRNDQMAVSRLLSRHLKELHSKFLTIINATNLGFYNRDKIITS
ncbi:RNase H domain-containing protein [Trichonephila inaurata madagascariensis]|uniref:RNase H domain-containing protein n=1 Tax=Trichonephila inaurata madagascariensis TaxID=2747483 RepID=A0A8X6YG73_9ARAC|nr:RNase H domain-containing protein [Trichonephila inaurata madagascariensis]